jgi:hypothetical protein
MQLIFFLGVGFTPRTICAVPQFWQADPPPRGNQGLASIELYFIVEFIAA